MIVGTTHTPIGLETLLQNLHLRPETFYLTGSRYLGTATAVSDWDFFVEDGPGVRSGLSKLGFRREWVSQYDDQSISAVLKHNAFNVHIQLVRRAAVKASVQQSIAVQLKLAASKDESRRIWRASLAVAMSQPLV